MRSCLDLAAYATRLASGFRGRRDGAGLADGEDDGEVLVVKDLGSEDGGLVGDLFLAGLADLEVQTVRPDRLLDVGGRRLDSLRPGGDGEAAGFTEEDQVTIVGVEEDLDAE